MPRERLSQPTTTLRLARAAGVATLTAVMIAFGSGPASAATTPPEVVPNVPAPVGEFPEEFYVYAGDLYYPTPGGAFSVLARFDGTTATVYDTDDDVPNPSNLTEFQSALFMSAGQDGDVTLASFTTAGGFVNYPTAPDGVDNLEVSDGVLYFSADPVGVLHSFDGTTLAPVAGSPTAISDVVAFDGALYFAGDVAGVRSIWSYDAVGGFQEVAGTAGAPFRDLFVFDGALHFVGTDGALWRIDGAATGPLAGSPLNPGSFVEFGGALYLSSLDPAAPGVTRLVGDTFSSVDPDFVYDSAFVFDGVLYFSAAVDAVDGVLYPFDGTTVGAPILPEPVQVGPSALVYGEAIYFAATDSADEDGLWRIALVPAPGEEPEPELAATGTEWSSLLRGVIAALVLLTGGLVLGAQRRDVRSTP